MRLALALGKFPGEIDSMPYVDYLELQELYRIEPWGLPVKDAMSAHAISVLANVNRDSKKRPEAYTIKDFLLFAGPAKPVPETLVEGKTGAQWKLIFGAEALQAAQKASRSIESN